MIKLWWTGTDRDSHPWFLRIYSELILSPLTFALDRDLCVDLIWRFNNSPAFPGTSEPCARKNELFAFKHLHVLSSKRVFRWKRLDTFGSNFPTRPGEVQIPPPPPTPGQGSQMPVGCPMGDAKTSTLWLWLCSLIYITFTFYSLESRWANATKTFICKSSLTGTSIITWVAIARILLKFIFIK